MIPKKRQIYNFFDDGKCSPSRLYKAYVKKVIPFNKADIHLKIHLVNSALDYDWIWNGDTDYFIGCYIPKYDNHLVWFARTKYGSWFSMDIQSNWQGGLLDVNRYITIQFLTLINFQIMGDEDRIDPDDWYDMGFPYSRRIRRY